MKDALDKVAFLPFGKLIDQWRWDVFSGKIKPEQVQRGLVGAAREVPGHRARRRRAPRPTSTPGAKYHVPANVPYMRYFLARILQFQFHRALCQAAGHKGPLHECSIYGNKAAGDKLQAMLAMGASKPWPEALEALTGDAADGRAADARVLRAAAEVARGAEQGPAPAAGSDRPPQFMTRARVGRARSPRG